MGEPLRIGILGAARIADRAIVEPARLAGHRLVAVAARDPDRAAAFAATHGVERVVASYAELVEDGEVDVVYNPLANALHQPWNLRAIAAGKHVLTEKPSAGNAGEAREVRDALAGTGQVFMEAFHYPYHPIWARIRELIASGELGEVRHVEAPMAMAAPGPDDPRWQWELAGGGAMDVGCYSLSALRLLGDLLGGTPTITAARMVESAAHPRVDQEMSVDLAYPGGATGRAGATMTAPVNDFSMTISASRGTVHVPCFVVPSRDDRVVVSTGAAERVEELGRRSSYTYQLEALADAVHGGEPVLTGADFAVTNMGWVDTAYTMAGLPRRVSVAI